MDQYHPDGRVLREPTKFASLTRPLRADEHKAALSAARDAGLRRIDARRPHPRLRRRFAVL
jgi:putative pyruvate formate lyase activating enzyme